jgi:hypothetical protein
MFGSIGAVVRGRDKVNVHFFYSMYTSTIFEHSLSVTLRVGLYPWAAMVARILVKAAIIAALFLEGIAPTRMALTCRCMP